MLNTEYHHYQISTADVFEYLLSNNITLDDYPDWNLIKKIHLNGEIDVKLIYNDIMNKDVTILSDGEVLGVYPNEETEYPEDILIRNEYTGHYWDMPRGLVNLLLEHGAYTGEPKNIPNF